VAREDLNRYLHSGRLARDPAGNLYYAFTYLPEPTVRKYDRYGYARVEIELATLEFQSSAQAVRREIARLESGGSPRVTKTITAIAVDPDNQEIWVALGAQLLHFTADGRRLAAYRTYTAQGGRIEASAILVESGRLLVASDSLGVFEFARPARPVE